MLLAVFKTDVTRDPGQAGSIPVRLRHNQHGWERVQWAWIVGGWYPVPMWCCPILACKPPPHDWGDPR
ncbi:hypothetical protein AMIS_59070 [Actinoplanes missouriensis 431]|uniref:Uncharacterized protein n=1 Tax=Actinoplanes missouriensis (strain ATCC 14538 / DSM 43046 / CBS 188.64 / JCM 3121 / NBRC 102363 / NCIMB 12654 / NRRL B-3342 / UNCC 431) TaxID=512565 RepID=I0HDP0_ACTM4|nr:hypothetical protein AMIS_59070 [Actinoplanes missouriensis 431]